MIIQQKDNNGNILNNQELCDKFYRRIKDPNNPEDLVNDIVNKLKIKNIKLKIDYPNKLRQMLLNKVKNQIQKHIINI